MRSWNTGMGVASDQGSPNRDCDYTLQFCLSDESGCCPTENSPKSRPWSAGARDPSNLQLIAIVVHCCCHLRPDDGHWVVDTCTNGKDQDGEAPILVQDNMHWDKRLFECCLWFIDEQRNNTEESDNDGGDDGSTLPWISHFSPIESENE